MREDRGNFWEKLKSIPKLMERIISPHLSNSLTTKSLENALTLLSQISPSVSYQEKKFPKNN